MSVSNESRFGQPQNQPSLQASSGKLGDYTFSTTWKNSSRVAKVSFLGVAAIASVGATLFTLANAPVVLACSAALLVIKGPKQLANSLTQTAKVVLGVANLIFPKIDRTKTQASAPFAGSMVSNESFESDAFLNEDAPDYELAQSVHEASFRDSQSSDLLEEARQAATDPDQLPPGQSLIGMHNAYTDNLIKAYEKRNTKPVEQSETTGGSLYGYDQEDDHLGSLSEASFRDSQSALSPEIEQGLRALLGSDYKVESKWRLLNDLNQKNLQSFLNMLQGSQMGIYNLVRNPTSNMNKEIEEINCSIANARNEVKYDEGKVDQLLALLMTRAQLGTTNSQVVTDHFMRAIYTDEYLKTNPAGRKLKDAGSSYRDEIFEKANGFRPNLHLDLATRGRWLPDDNSKVNLDGKEGQNDTKCRLFIKGFFQLELSPIEKEAPKELRFDIDLSDVLNENSDYDRVVAAWDFLDDIVKYGSSSERKKATYTFFSPGDFDKLEQVGKKIADQVLQKVALALYERTHPN